MSVQSSFTLKLTTMPFISVVFSLFALFVCSFVLMFYMHKILKYIVVLLLRYLFLPSTSRLRLGGLLIAPLNCRIFFQDIFYQDENMTLRVVDGYVSFAFWDSWLRDPSWTTVKEFFLNDNLKGKDCLVKIRGRWVHGTIVGVRPEERKLLVQPSSGDADGRDGGVEADVDEERNANNVDGTCNGRVGVHKHGPLSYEMNVVSGKSRAQTGEGEPTEAVDFRGKNNANRKAGNSGNRDCNRGNDVAFGTSGSDADAADARECSSHANCNVQCRPFGRFTSCGSFVTEKVTFSPAEVGNSNGDERCNAGPSAIPIDSPNVCGDDALDHLILCDLDVVRIRKSRGRVRVHMNGLGVSLYNATSNYRNPAAAETETQSVPRPRSNPRTWSVMSFMRLGSLRELFLWSPKCEEDRTANAAQQPNGLGKDSSRPSGSKQQADAEAEQRRAKDGKSSLQRFFEFIGAVEVELFSSSINIGGARARHPYFFHIGFKRAESRIYLTDEGVSSIDLYRLVTEATVEELESGWRYMGAQKKRSKTHDGQADERNKWRDSFLLLFKNTPQENMPEPLLDEPCELISSYGTLIDINKKSTVHAVFYRDVPNVYAGEVINRESELPRSGLELFVDTPELCFGPWSGYSFMELKEYFYPNTFRSIDELEFVIGQPRPHGGMEVFVKFLGDTCIMMPFKRKTISPVPPFGIEDSGLKGVLMLTLGAGTTYVQRPQFLLAGEDKQKFEGMLSARNVWVATNAIQEESAVLAHIEQMDLFIDRLDDKQYNGRKLWNFIPKLTNAEIWWYFDYLMFFWDLIMDWQFLPFLYHDVQLTTEWYNTRKFFIDEFIPNVKRIEILTEGTLNVHFNCNMHNTVFSDDINDLKSNTFLTLRVKGGGHLFATIPMDAYMLSAVTEVKRPFEMALHDLELLLSVPTSHPLYEQINCSVPFWYLEELCLSGMQFVNFPNQSVPMDPSPVDPTTGRTKITNLLDFNFQMDGLRGSMMAPHLTTLLDLISNCFSANCCVVRPDELFWPQCKVQPKIDRPRNVRSMFHDYLRLAFTPSNNQDINLTIIVNDINMELCGGGLKGPQLDLHCGKLAFAVIKQSGINDITLTVSPITGKVRDICNDVVEVDKSFICCGDIRLGVRYHFGPQPMRVCFHSAVELVIDGISFYLSVEQLAMLVHLVNLLVEQFGVRDEALLEAIETARAVAAYSAENYVLQTTTIHLSNSHVIPISVFSMDLSPVVHEGTSSTPSMGCGREFKSVGDIRGTLRRFLARIGALQKLPFSDVVPGPVVADFYKFLESTEQATDEAKDYAVNTFVVSITRAGGCLVVGSEGYIEAKLPTGIHVASTTLNDVNSNRRITAIVRDVALRGFCWKGGNEAGDTGQLVEVFRMETSLHMQQYIAYPFDNDLQTHKRKQHEFIIKNDVDKLFTLSTSSKEAAHPPTRLKHSFKKTTCTASGEAAVEKAVDAEEVVAGDPNTERDTVHPVSDMRGSKTLRPEEVELFARNAHDTVVPDTPVGVLLDVGGADCSVSVYGREDAACADGGRRYAAEEPGASDLKTAVCEADSTVSRLSGSEGDSGKNSPSTAPACNNNNQTALFGTCHSLTDDFFSTSDDETEGLRLPSVDGDAHSACLSQLKDGNEERELNEDSSSCNLDIAENSVGDVQAALKPLEMRVGKRRARRRPPGNVLSRCLHSFSIQSTVAGMHDLPNYTPASWSGRAKVFDNTNFHAPLPTVSFVPSAYSEEAPRFLMSDQVRCGAMESRDTDVLGVADHQDCDVDSSINADNAQQSWAKRTAENRQRSRDGITTKHIHVRAVSPLTVLLTQQFFQKLLFVAEGKFIHMLNFYHSVRISDAAVDTEMDGRHTPVQSSRNGRGMRSDGDKWRRKTLPYVEGHVKELVESKHRSRTREHQKRWLSSVNILSACAPCVEVNVLTELRLPPGNEVPRMEAKGAYTTLLCCKSFQFVLRRTRPPKRAPTSAVSKSLSGSIRLSSLASVTQIEYEPLLRSGNVCVNIPGIVYDKEKETLAVFYFTSFCGRVRHQNICGMEKGICRLTVDTLALHVSRDFFFYLHSMLELADSLLDHRNNQASAHPFREHHTAETVVSFPETGGESTKSPTVAPEVGSNFVLGYNRHNHTGVSTYGIEESRVVTGMCSIKTIRIELFDTQREDHYILVNTKRKNVIEVHQLLTRFTAKISAKHTGGDEHLPLWEHAPWIKSKFMSQNASTTHGGGGGALSSSTSSDFCQKRVQQHVVQLHFIGELDSIVVKCFSSVLPVLTTMLNCRKAEETVGILPVDTLVGENEESASAFASGCDGFPHAGQEKCGVLLFFRGSFTFRRVDICLLQAKMNFLQFKAVRLAGYGESRAEPISSHECVDTHVLSEAISPQIRARLHAWARRARARIPQRHYVAPPAVTPQLHLKNSAFFTAESVLLQYVADAIVCTSPGSETSNLAEVEEKVLEESRVFVATATQIMMSLQQSIQNSVRDNAEASAGKESDALRFGGLQEVVEGKQFNLGIEICSVNLSVPYRPRANEIVEPQLHHWTKEWIKSHNRWAVGTKQVHPFDDLYTLGNAPKSKWALCCATTVRDIQLQNALPQSISADMRLPLVSCFLNASSDSRLSLKAHLSPFTVSSSNKQTVIYRTNFPNIYLVYAKDETRVSGMCLMETVEVTVSPIIISHLLFIYSRCLTVHRVLMMTMGDCTTPPTTPQSVRRENLPSVKYKSNFVFLLEGLRVSYLTSMTNLRFSVRRLVGTSTIVHEDELYKSQMTVNVSKAQVALVDRDDYDQLQAFLNQTPLVSPSADGNLSSPEEGEACCQHSSAADMERPRLMYPLSGFIWGLLETSLRLSTGRSVTSELRTTLENIAASAIQDSFDLRDLETMGNTATRWNVVVPSPLIIARIGLVPLLQRSIDETKSLVAQTRLAAERDNSVRHRQLSKSAVYKQLARTERQINETILKTREMRIKRIIQLTSRVRPPKRALPQRSPMRGASAETAASSHDDGDLFQTTSDLKVFATVTNFLFVLPFGDAAYRNVLEEVLHAHEHSHSELAPLNRKRFIPTMAIKIKVENTSFACSLLQSQSCVPVFSLKTSPLRLNESIDAFFGKRDRDAKNTVLFTAKFVLSDAHLYCSDGSPLGKGVTASAVLNSTHILGGRGTLTSFSKSEYRDSLSKIAFDTIEVPLHISKRGNVVKVVSAMDLSAPQVRVSTRFVSVLGQLTKETTSRSLSNVFQRSRAARRPSASPKKRMTSSQPTSRESSGGNKGGRHVDPTGHSPNEQSGDADFILYFFDVTAHIEPGEVHVYSIKRDPTHSPHLTAAQGDAGRTKISRQAQRRVKFTSETLASKSGHPRCTTSSLPPSDGIVMAVLLNIPFPNITTALIAKYGGGPKEREETIVRVEMRASTIEVGPSIMSLAHEIEEWEAVYARDNTERIMKTLKLVQSWERNVDHKQSVFHSSIADLALPMPHAFASVLARKRPASTALILHRSRGQEKPLCNETEAPTPENEAHHKHTLFCLQLRITGIRLVLTTEPVSTVNFSIFLDDRNGFADICLQRTRKPLEARQSRSQAAIQPAALITLVLRQLHVECQAKLEMKSLEMHLREMDACITLRRHGLLWSLTSVCVHFPNDTSSGPKVEVTVHAPHTSQLLIVQALWHHSLLESLNSINKILARGASIIRANVKLNPGIQRHVDAMRRIQVEKTTTIVFSASQGKLRLDLGLGDALHISFSKLNLLFMTSRSELNGVWRRQFDVSLVGLTLRSEGELSGTARLETAMLKGFVVENHGHGGLSVSSSEGRTLRYILCAQKLQIVFKERQLKDVFESQLGEFTLNLMDGAGEGGSNGVQVDMCTSNGNVVVTPSTAPAFMGIVAKCSSIITQQRKITLAKLRDGGASSGVQRHGLLWKTGLPLEHSMKRPTCSAFSNTTSNSRTQHFEETASVLVDEFPGIGADETGYDSAGCDDGLSYIPFIGSKLTKIPCGAINVRLERSSLCLGSASAGINNADCLVANFPQATLSFAECLSNGDVIKRVLEIHTLNMELFRPGSTKVLILGFRDVNKFEFYTQQRIGDHVIGFMMSLYQVSPWTGNPRLQDFQELIQLVRSFTTKSNAEVFYRFGRVDDVWPVSEEGQPQFSESAQKPDEGNTTSDEAGVLSADDFQKTGTASKLSDDAGGVHDQTHQVSTHTADIRCLKPLCNVQFAPQLRFGGAVSVNVDVILNWFGITRKTLPYVVHTKACDRLEGALNYFGKKVEKQRERHKRQQQTPVGDESP
ncbi:hypothetical protein TRVL_00749 [Trypanosoma vivax]|nr:hypothetical protein TRVL_00749 [Trypanosoma vivax]